MYHRGQVSNIAAGLLPAGHSTVPENEDIIDLRYPFFRSQVSAFINSNILTSLHEEAAAKLMRDAVNEWGYIVEFGQLPRAMWDTNRPVVDIESREGVLVAVCRFFGVNYEIPVAASNELLKTIVDFFSLDPSIVHIGEPLLAAESLAATLDGLGVTYERTVCYPTRV